MGCDTVKLGICLDNSMVENLEKEIEMIKSALERAKGKRKVASQELGISERTLYRKIKQFNLCFCRMCTLRIWLNV